MQKMQGQKPALEETRNRKVTYLTFLCSSYLFFNLQNLSAQLTHNNINHAQSTEITKIKKAGELVRILPN